MVSLTSKSCDGCGYILEIGSTPVSCPQCGRSNSLSREEVLTPPKGAGDSARLYQVFKAEKVDLEAKIAAARAQAAAEKEEILESEILTASALSGAEFRKKESQNSLIWRSIIPAIIIIGSLFSDSPGTGLLLGLVVWFFLARKQFSEFVRESINSARLTQELAAARSINVPQLADWEIRRDSVIKPLEDRLKIVNEKYQENWDRITNS